MKKSEKLELINKHSPHTRCVKNFCLAFIFGAVICGVGEGLIYLFSYLGADERSSPMLTTLFFIFLASILTGFGLFDVIAKRAGAGTLVPVTGFSNAVTSEAMDSKSEGIILGVGAKIFTVAGPVILFGITAGVVYGIVLFFYYLFSGGIVVSF
ncbi:MAG: SpoVA/SpoVAEb family sporulation membrane protein [Clostridia bacterium]|nr:SpoVA/SpoVAEb family sporulation membrane protein [Clostridia bacterium]